MPDTVEANGREYRIPEHPTVVVCIDGSDPAYLDDALSRGLMPSLAASLANGATYAIGRSQLPSFTNPNNVSIVTGLPPAGHGIPGNHYLGPDGREVALTDPRLLRAPTIHARFAEAGVPVACITTKDKLRYLLSAGGVPCLSVERADWEAAPWLGAERASDLVGRPAPAVYDPDCSVYALELGLAVMGKLGTGLFYVSLTDYVQHAHAPGEPVADRFYTLLDELWARYLDAGARLALVADHGMNAKSSPSGEPNVRHLDDVLERARVSPRRVVLPITDPYLVHHAALGSAAWVHVAARKRARAAAALAALEGVEEVMTREQAATELELPPDRIGDLVLLADAQTVLGKSAATHDLSELRGPLRSHGGRYEQRVPLVFSHPLRAHAAARLREGVSNAEVHDLLLNGML